jgi:hypothetical protein
MTTTAVPQIEFTSTGLVVPSEPAVLAGCQADWNSAFGGILNPALNTPQGQLASSESALIANNNALFAQMINLINPATSSGFMQDAIAQIYFLTRNPALPTIVQCTCAGLDGTVIPIGALATDTSGNLYVSQSAGTISSGTVVLPFANVVDGPIACPAATLTNIYQGINGWESITNVAAGVIGQNVETPQAFEYRRQQSVALNSHGPVQAIYGVVFALPGITDAYCAENVLASTVDVGSTNYPMVQHSIYVSVYGSATSAAVAQAIYSKKGPGCNYNGDTTVAVTDTSGYEVPYPTYNVSFHWLTNTPILFAVDIANNASLPSNIVGLVQAAIINAFTGGDGGTRARAGALLSAGRFYAGVMATSPFVSVNSILLGSASATLTSQLIGIDQEPTITAANIVVNLV